MLTEIFVDIWRHSAMMSYDKTKYLDIDPFNN